MYLLSHNFLHFNILAIDIQVWAFKNVDLIANFASARLQLSTYFFNLFGTLICFIFRVHVHLREVLSRDFNSKTSPTQ